MGKSFNKETIEAYVALACLGSDSASCYFGNFTKKEDVANAFNTDLTAHIILYAEYQSESYEGSALVLFWKDEELWEVRASHCSCNGLEEGWEPERVTPEILEKSNTWWGKSWEGKEHMTNLFNLFCIGGEELGTDTTT